MKATKVSLSSLTWCGASPASTTQVLTDSTHLKSAELYTMSPLTWAQRNRSKTFLIFTSIWRSKKSFCIQKNLSSAGLMTLEFGLSSNLVLISLFLSETPRIDSQDCKRKNNILIRWSLSFQKSPKKAAITFLKGISGFLMENLSSWKYQRSQLAVFTILTHWKILTKRNGTIRLQNSTWMLISVSTIANRQQGLIGVWWWLRLNL